MSGTQTLQTAQQPALAASNIAAHPGSTWAGIGALAAGAGQMIAANGLPTNTASWVVFGLSILGGLGGLFGK